MLSRFVLLNMLNQCSIIYHHTPLDVCQAAIVYHFSRKHWQQHCMWWLWFVLLTLTTFRPSNDISIACDCIYLVCSVPWRSKHQAHAENRVKMGTSNAKSCTAEKSAVFFESCCNHFAPLVWFPRNRRQEMHRSEILDSWIRRCVYLPLRLRSRHIYMDP